MSLLLRMRKKGASLEADLETFMKAELFAKGEPDLQLSVYEVVVESEDALRKRIVQVSAEHAISPPLDPKTLAHFDVSGLHPAVPEPGNTLFAFTRAAHRVLSFRDAGALRSFANGLRTAALQGTRLWKVSRDEMLDYAIARLDAGDGEWENAVERADNWRRKIGARRAEIRGTRS